MKEIKAVIGKNFGDEGKGGAVNCLCKDKRALVVRHNGGAQAGHTVEEENFRFVFHQMGSGSLQGADTYFSKTFLPDLLKLGEEAVQFKETAGKRKDLTIVVYAHPDCACVTVFDVLLNSLKEQLRGNSKHGSCGMGIYEAVLRTERKHYALYLKDFQNAKMEEIVCRLHKIRDEYIVGQLQELQNCYEEQWRQPYVQNWLELIFDENVCRNAARLMCDHFEKYLILSEWRVLAQKYETIIFENAQGLLLDRNNREYFPHLTPSDTGLFNVVNLLSELEYCCSIEVIYVTRTYVTRHGAGRLDYECLKEKINADMQDFTNVPNPWQDTLRYAKHPMGDEFFRYMEKDLRHLEILNARADKRMKIRVSLLLTHLDETQNKVVFADKNVELKEFMEECEKRQIFVYVQKPLQT